MTAAPLLCTSAASYHQNRIVHILIHKIHPDNESLNLRGCQSSLNSLSLINNNTVRAFSTNRQLFMKDQSSQPTICKPKGTAPACYTVLHLHVFYKGVV